MWFCRVPLGTVLVNVFINDVDAGLQCALSLQITLRGAVDYLEGGEDLQREPLKLRGQGNHQCYKV